MIVYDVLICKSPEQTDTCYFPMMLHVYTITFWESLVIVGIWDFQSCVNWMVISALEQCLLLLFWIVCQWMEKNLFDHRCAVHLFTIHFVFVHKCLAFSSKLGRTFFFSLFSFLKKKKKVNWVIVRLPERDLNIWYSTPASHLRSEKILPLHWLLWHLTFRFHACSLHMGLPHSLPLNSGSAFKWCINTIKQPLKFCQVDQPANKAKFFWRISRDIRQDGWPRTIKSA